MIRIVRTTALVLAALAALAAVVYFVATRSPRIPVNGREHYVRYCASCHGVGGRGDGPAADAIQPRPTDLTRLRERYGGQYPIREVMGAIDGRYPVRAHGDSAMPVWGIVFEQEKEKRKAR